MSAALLALPGQAALASARRAALAVPDIPLALREFPEVKQIYSRIGTTNGRNSSFLNAKLVPRAERKFTQKQLEQKFRERLRRIAGIELSVGWMRPIQVSIVGPDAQQLKEIGAEVERALAGIKGVTEIESSEKTASPTLAIRINRQLASDLGLTLSQIANATRPLIAGDAVAPAVTSARASTAPLRPPIPTRRTSGRRCVRARAKPAACRSPDASPAITKTSRTGKLHTGRQRRSCTLDLRHDPERHRERLAPRRREARPGLGRRAAPGPAGGGDAGALKLAPKAGRAGRPGAGDRVRGPGNPNQSPITI